MDEPGPVEIPVDGTLDLHTFHPREVKRLVPDYLQECRRRGILSVRIVHGKGTGVLRSKVHSVLKRLPYVIEFKLGDLGSGSWGATLVQLRPEGDGPA
jgi:DNA-nicking Smr family endonuclease